MPITPYDCEDLVDYPTVEEITAVLEEAAVAPYPDLNDPSLFAGTGTSMEA